MRCLIDTHTLIWWWDERERLSVTALDTLENSANDIFVSAASAWEIAIKVGRGLLPQMKPKLTVYEDSLAEDHFRHLAVDHRHSIRAGLFAGRHRDPFDRVLAAQSILEDMVILTRDRAIAAFGARTLW